MQKLKNSTSYLQPNMPLEQKRRSACVSLLMNKGKFEVKLPRIWTADRKRRVDRSSQKSDVKQSRLDRHAQRVRIQRIDVGGCFCFLIRDPQQPISPIPVPFLTLRARFVRYSCPLILLSVFSRCPPSPSQCEVPGWGPALAGYTLKHGSFLHLLSYCCILV